MSGASPIITPAPVPPSIAGQPQPVFDSGSATSPATPIDITGSPILPPPLMGDPVGVPDFPPVDPDTAPVPVPVGPLVGPAVGPAPVPPSLPGVQQPQFAGGGSYTVPASLFPDFTTDPPSPPIVFANIFNLGNVPPPSTPGIAPIQPSPIANIPQLPWPPITTPPPSPPPVNTVRPTVTGTAEVGSTLTSTTGTWTNATSEVRDWTRNGSPIAGATGATYTLEPVDVGAMIGVNVTATGAGGETSMDSLAVGPVAGPPEEDEPTEPATRAAPRAAPKSRTTRRKR
jgi:hypothetical protein